MVSNQDNRTEARIQQDAIVYIRGKYPQTHGCIWHVPNGGVREKVNASILTGQGITPGIQDIHILWNGVTYLVEMKDATGPVSAEQKVIHATHKLHGKDTYIFRNSDQLISFVEHIIFDKPLHAFAIYISPYSVAASIPQFKEELFQINKRKQDKKLQRRHV